MGDVNSDGADDIAVGAPTDGPGKIFIYFGEKGAKTADELFKASTADQTIEAEAINKKFTNNVKLRQLGSALSGGSDVDADGYPDLAAGSYETNTVVLFGSHPTLYVEAELKLPDALLDPAKYKCSANPAQQSCRWLIKLLHPFWT